MDSDYNENGNWDDDVEDSEEYNHDEWVSWWENYHRYPIGSR